MSFHYALLSCTLRYYTSLHFQASAPFHYLLVIMCISGSFFCSTTGSADEDFLRLCPIYILISCKTKIHLRIFPFLEVYDNHQQYYITTIQKQTQEKREIMKNKKDEKETKTVHEEVTRNGGIMDSVMVFETDGKESLLALRNEKEMSSFCG